MNQPIEEFILIIEEEMNLLEDLHALLLEKKQAVIDASVDTLNRLGREIHVVQAKIQQTEIRRQELFEDVAGSLNRRPGELNLKQLSLVVPDPHAARLRRCRAEFLNVAGRIKQINGSIRSLLAHTLHLVAGSFNTLSGITSPHTVYGDRGMTQGRNQSGRLLSRNV